jgi:hypothetical protein
LEILRVSAMLISKGINGISLFYKMDVNNGMAKEN